MKNNLQQYLKEQVMVSQKEFRDKKLQTGDDHIESFENTTVNEHAIKTRLQEVEGLLNGEKKQEDKQEDKKKTRRIKVVGPNGEIEYVTEQSDDEGVEQETMEERKKRKERR